MAALLEDIRPIERLIFDGEAGMIIQGQGHVEAIQVCHVNGEMAAIAWFEVLDKKGKVISRVNSRYVIKVIYF